MARRRSRGGDFQLLVAPVQWTRTMAIKRLFEEREVPARIIGAGTAEAAISQLKKMTNIVRSDRLECLSDPGP